MGFLFEIFNDQNQSTNFRIPKIAMALDNFEHFLLPLSLSLFIFHFSFLFNAMQKIKKLEIIWRQTNLMTDYGHWLFVRVCVYLSHEWKKKNNFWIFTSTLWYFELCASHSRRVSNHHLLFGCDKWLLINQKKEWTQIKRKSDQQIEFATSSFFHL